MGEVYFLQAKVEPPLFKVGYTGASINARMRAIQTACPYELSLYASLQGTLSLEAEIHKELEDFHAHGEWFRIEPSQIDNLLSLHGMPPAVQYAEIIADGYLAGWVRLPDGEIFIPLGMFSKAAQTAYFATGEIARIDKDRVYVNLKEVERDYIDDPEMADLLAGFRHKALGYVAEKYYGI